MSYPMLRLPILRQWESARGITAGLRRMLDEDRVLMLPASLSDRERGEIVDLLVLYLDLPARIVEHPEEARPGELSLLARPVDRAPPAVAAGVLVCFKRRAPTDRRLEITDKIITLRDAVIQSIGKQYEGTRLMIVARWALEAADSPSTALGFAAGAFAAHLDDPTISDPALYAAGLAGAIGGMLRGVDLRVAEWMVAFATGAPSPGRLLSNEALLLGESTAILRGLDEGLVLLAPEEPGDLLELRRPLETLRHFDTLKVKLTLADVAKPLAATLDPQVRLVLDRLLRPERKRLGLEGPRPVAGLLGREEMIARLVALFDPANTIRTTVLYGVAGVGKRQVAAAVCDAMAGRFEPVWVRFAEGPEAGWMRVASALGVDTNRAEAVAVDREGVPRWVRRVHDGLRFLPCLLVVEGVDAMREDDLAKWLPSGAGTSAVLVLSRSAQRPLQRAHEAIAVRLEGHAVQAARRILAAHAPQLTEEILRGDADKLIDHVGGNATALALAGALLEHKSLLEVTSAVRRGEEGIPAVLREVIDTLPEEEKALLWALAVCVPGGSPADLALRIAERKDGREAFDRLVDRAMIVSDGRKVRLVEVVRLEAERRLDRNKEARRALEAAHARDTQKMFTDARERRDLTTQEDLHGDLRLATERATALCKAGEREIAGTVAGLANELTYYPGGDAGENARLAVEAFHAALAVEPGNMDWQRELSVVHDKVGDSLRERGDTMRARAAYRASFTIREHLAQQDPTNTMWQCDLSVSHNEIGGILGDQGDKEGALAAYRDSLAIRERLVQQDPANMEWQRRLCASHDRIGDVLLDQGDKESALAAYRDSFTICKHLAQQDPSNMEWQRNLALSHTKIGDVLLDQGDKEGALAAYRDSFTIRKRLAQQDPANTMWQRDLSVSHERIGNVLRAQGDKEGALTAYRAALTIRERLAQRDPANTMWQRDLSLSHLNTGSVLLAKGDKVGAVAAYQAALAISERLARHDPANAEWQTDLALICWKLADALPTGTPAERAEVRAYLERARRILGDLAATSRLTHDEQAWLPGIEAALRALPP